MDQNLCQRVYSIASSNRKHENGRVLSGWAFELRLDPSQQKDASSRCQEVEVRRLNSSPRHFPNGSILLSSLPFFSGRLAPSPFNYGAKLAKTRFYSHLRTCTRVLLFPPPPPQFVYFSEGENPVSAVRYCMGFETSDLPHLLLPPPHDWDCRNFQNISSPPPHLRFYVPPQVLIT